MDQACTPSRPCGPPPSITFPSPSLSSTTRNMLRSKPSARSSTPPTSRESTFLASTLPPSPTALAAPPAASKGRQISPPPSPARLPVMVPSSWTSASILLFLSYIDSLLCRVVGVCWVKEDYKGDTMLHFWECNTV